MHPILVQFRDFVIVNANKEEALVIMHLAYYIEISERQLNNKDHYQQLLKDQAAVSKETVNNIIKRFQK